MATNLFKRTAMASALVAALAAGGIGLASHGAQAGMPGAVLLTDPSATSAAPAAAAAALPVSATALDFSGIVERFGPAVVNISVTGKAAAPDTEGMAPDDPMFEFFKRFGPQFQVPPQGRIMRGQGSGFIVSADGLILTNAHVVDKADRVTVKLTDRREFVAKVLGSDPRSDVAVLRIEAHNLPVVRLGDPRQVKVGEPVLAIGSPFGLENTATAGIVSAKARSLPSDTYVPFIQTDVAVNPGNSGGPLFNARGEVIGINSQIYSRTGGYQGLSFAIPIDFATRVQQQLVASGHVNRGRLGVAIQEVNQALANAFGLPRPMGALVSSVDKDGPAAKAGVEVGDVIVSVDGKPIDSSADLPALVGEMKPGVKAELGVVRKGANRTLTAHIGAFEQVAKLASDEPTLASSKIGLAVRPLERAEQQQAGLSGGLLIERASGPAARAGLQPGDVIVSANGNAVATVDQLRRALNTGKPNVALLVRRDDATIFIPVDLG